MQEVREVNIAEVMATGTEVLAGFGVAIFVWRMLETSLSGNTGAGFRAGLSLLAGRIIGKLSGDAVRYAAVTIKKRQDQKVTA